jgi:hypothetical protein
MVSYMPVAKIQANKFLTIDGLYRTGLLQRLNTRQGDFMISLPLTEAAHKAVMLRKQVKLLDGTDSETIQKNLDSAISSVNLDYFAKHDMTDEIARVAVLIDTPLVDIHTHVDKLIEQRKRDKDYKSESSMLRCVLDQAMEKIVAPKLPLDGDPAVITHRVRQAIKSNLPTGFFARPINPHTDPRFEAEIEKAVEFVKVSMTPGTEVSDSIKPYAELIALNQAEAKSKSSEAILSATLSGNLDDAEARLAEAEKLATAAVSKQEADRISAIKAEVLEDIKEIKSRIQHINKISRDLPEADKVEFKSLLSDALSGCMGFPVTTVTEEVVTSVSPEPSVV